MTEVPSPMGHLRSPGRPPPSPRVLTTLWPVSPQVLTAEREENVRTDNIQGQPCRPRPPVCPPRPVRPVTPRSQGPCHGYTPSCPAPSAWGSRPPHRSPLNSGFCPTQVFYKSFLFVGFGFCFNSEKPPLGGQFPNYGQFFRQHLLMWGAGVRMCPSNTVRHQSQQPLTCYSRAILTYGHEPLQTGRR